MTHPDHQPDRPLGWWLKHVDGLMEIAFDRALDREGIARPHWQVLNAVAGGASGAAEVADAFTRLGEREERARSALEQLVARGWLRLAGERVELTPAGVLARERLATSVRAEQRRATEGIGTQQYRTTVETLRRMAGNLADRPGNLAE